MAHLRAIEALPSGTCPDLPLDHDIPAKGLTPDKALMSWAGALELLQDPDVSRHSIMAQLPHPEQYAVGPRRDYPDFDFATALKLAAVEALPTQLQPRDFPRIEERPGHH